jgi:peptidoglycan/LPS O-acetylase OafA/YrhL
MGTVQIVCAKLFAKIVTVPEYLQANYDPSLTGLRGVAIMIVLLYHLGINRLLREFDCWILGRLGVDIFFALSHFALLTCLDKWTRAGSASCTTVFNVRFQPHINYDCVRLS